MASFTILSMPSTILHSIHSSSSNPCRRQGNDIPQGAQLRCTITLSPSHACATPRMQGLASTHLHMHTRTQTHHPSVQLDSAPNASTEASSRKSPSCSLSS